MDNSWYSFDVSPLWVLVAIIAAAGVSLLLYSRKKMPWSKPMNILLGFLRFAAIFLIILLILNPLLKLNTNTTEAPIVILAMDNSESIQLRESGTNITQLNQWLQYANSELGSSYKVKIEGLPTDSVSATDKTTNISSFLKSLETKYENTNVGAVVLATDGIVNNGQAPDYLNYKYPIYTLGLGDTIPPKDIVIQSVRNNKVAYQGNKFPIAIQVFQKGFEGHELAVYISENGQRVASKTVDINRPVHDIEFLIDADNAGLRRFTIDLAEKEGESSYENNHQDIYVDVVEGKDKVLILAPAPHPDISAIRRVLEETDNYETSLFIPGIKQAPRQKDYDLIIEHQAFSTTSYGDYTSSGKWYIMGSRTLPSKLTQSINFLNIAAKGNQKDQVRPSINNDFTKFKLNKEELSRLDNYPPIQVPFGEYTLTGPTETLFYQRVGTITTERPLLVFYDDGNSKIGLLTGEGMWQWRLQESGQNNDSKLFDDIILKTVQYLSIKVNKDRFVAKPREANYQVGDRVIIDTEVYNEIFERAYGNKINLTITDQQGNINTYELVDNPSNSAFNIGTMEPGIYTFRATTSLGGKTFTEQGSFAVKDIQLEGINLTADHRMLRRVSENSGGQFFSFNNGDQLINALKQQEFKSLIKTDNQRFPLIDSIWVILLIIGLLTAEWFLRKYLGAY